MRFRPLLCAPILLTLSPQAQSATLACPSPNPVRIGILPNGTTTWNNEPVRSKLDLNARLRRFSTAVPCPTAAPVPDKHATYQQIMSVLKLMVRNGIQSPLVGNVRPD